jgi:uncharacterized damage-inducible protein DinB
MAEPRDSELRAQLAREWRALLETVSPGWGGPLELPPERRMALGRMALFAQLEEARADFRALRSLVDEELGAKFVNAGWTLQDLLAHIASWAGEFRRQIETASRHESFDYSIPFAMSVMGPTEWNQREVEKRRDRTLPEIFEEYEVETSRLQELVISLDEPELYRGQEFPIAPSGRSDERWRGPGAVIIAGKCVHDRYHLRQIRERLGHWRTSKSKR